MKATETLKEITLFLLIAGALIGAAIFFAATWRRSQGKCSPMEFDWHLYQVCEDATSYTRIHDRDCGKCRK